jgi:tRNA(Arg) A34 adenosine deaminase TadA
LQTAWIEAPGGLILRADQETGSSHPLDSAISQLIVGINIEFTEERYRYLRLPIYCNYQPSLWDMHLIKVCAKRLVISIGQAPPPPRPSRHVSIGATVPAQLTAIALADDEIPPRGTFMDRRGSLELVQRMAALQQLRTAAMKRHQAPRAVAAALFDGDSKLITATVNTNAQCQVLHAEVNLIAQLRKLGFEQIPFNATLVTSLKPCRMCAALLIELGAREHHLQILAAADDSGTFGRHKILDGLLTITPAE